MPLYNNKIHISTVIVNALRYQFDQDTHKSRPLRADVADGLSGCWRCGIQSTDQMKNSRIAPTHRHQECGKEDFSTSQMVAGEKL